MIDVSQVWIPAFLAANYNALDMLSLVWVSVFGDFVHRHNLFYDLLQL